MIVGKRVRFRAVEKADQHLLVSWINDPYISQLVGGWSFPISLAAQEDWFSRVMNDQKNQRWMVESLEGEPLGLTGLSQIDWHNRTAFPALKLGASNSRGKGYGTDAIMTLMTYAFLDVGLNRLWGEILPHNIESYKAFVEKCGWRVEGVFRQHIYRNGVYMDQLRVAILRDEFLRLPQAKDYIPAEFESKIEVRPEHWALPDISRS